MIHKINKFVKGTRVVLASVLAILSFSITSCDLGVEGVYDISYTNDDASGDEISTTSFKSNSRVLDLTTSDSSATFSYNGSDASSCSAWLVAYNPTGSSITLPTGVNVSSNYVEMVNLASVSSIISSPTGHCWNPSEAEIVQIREKFLKNEEDSQEVNKKLNPSAEINKSVAGDATVGSSRNFYLINTDDYSYDIISATLKLKRTVETDTAGGKRTLLIYQQDGMGNSSSLPSAQDYQDIANVFLRDGEGNDLYDMLTSMYGDDIGYYNSSKLNQNNPGSFSNDNVAEMLTDDVESITLLYCDIDGQGVPSGSYVAGFFFSWDYYNSDYAEASNGRPIIYMHAYTSGRSHLGDGLGTLSHEFQHLIHNQYYNSNFTKLSVSGDWPKGGDSNSSMMTEMLSASAEDYIASFIHAQINKEAMGLFAVGYGGNERGYLYSSMSGYGTAILNGRGPYTLGRLVGSTASYSSWDNTLYDYGKVAALAHYILVNYGADVITDYHEKQSLTSSTSLDLQKIVDSIKSKTSRNDLTLDQFMLEFGSAMMLSKVPAQVRPYSYALANSGTSGWYNVNNKKVPSVNLWLYRVAGVKSVAYGFQNSTEVPAYGIGMVKLKSSLTQGATNTITAPDSNLKTKIVVVPK